MLLSPFALFLFLNTLSSVHHSTKTRCLLSLNWRNMLILFWSFENRTWYCWLFLFFFKLYFLLAYLTLHCFYFSYYSSGLFLVLDFVCPLFSAKLLGIDVLQRFSPPRKWWNQENGHTAMLINTILWFLYMQI